MPAAVIVDQRLRQEIPSRVILSTCRRAAG